MENKIIQKQRQQKNYNDFELLNRIKDITGIKRLNKNNIQLEKCGKITPEPNEN